MAIVKIESKQDLFGNVVSKKVAIVDKQSLAPILSACLKNATLDQVVSLITNKYLEILEYVDLCQGGLACQKTSLLFNPHRLATRTSTSKMSIMDALQTDSYIEGIARASIFKREVLENEKLFYQILQLGVSGIGYVNEFPPAVMRNLCQKYRLGPSSRVLDPCGGWGGRMIGSSVVVNKYHAFEPSTKTHNGLMELSKFIQTFRPEFRPKIYNLPFEDSDLMPEFYDFACTSPPYFDTEEYSNEPTNSFNRYPTFDKWCRGFYIPMIRKTMNALKPDGCFVLNIGSRKYPLSKVMKDSFPDLVIRKLESVCLSGGSGLGKAGEGETFYELRKG